jgi:uncharacterized protein (DUF1015 family)
VADVRPFHGVHYNKSLIKDASTLICPPYDIITPQQQKELYLRNAYNFVRLEFARELPQDTANNNKYTRSAAIMEEWLKQGILEVDELPAIYLHDYYFSLQGKEYKRRSIIARVRLEEWDRRIIRPHEGTLTEPKGDRLSLLWALQANTSPILALYEDRNQQISSLLADQELNKPFISFQSINGEGQNLWAITDKAIVNQISRNLVDQPIYIADGHHRYESALAYKLGRQDYSPSVSGEEAFNFVMMALVAFSEPGLIILAPLRLVHGISSHTLNELMPKLSVFFEVDKLPVNMLDVREQVDTLFAERDRVNVILFGPDTENLVLLRLRDAAAISQMMPYFHSDLYKNLDVSITDHIILEKLLTLSSDTEKTSLAYSYDIQDAINRVLAQEYQLALLLSPVKPEVIKAIADAGDKMPRKSTYFYPKPPSGLVFNQLV